VLPAESVLRAANRLVPLLGRSSVDQALAVIKADPMYNDLSLTQYGLALDWLFESGLASVAAGGLSLAPELRHLPDELASQVLFSTCLEQSKPSWLRDADVLVVGVAELPQDAVNLARVFGLPDSKAFTAIRQVWGRVDLEELARIGAAGEAALVRLLEYRWPGSTRHVALESDGFCYDILLTIANARWHVEVKTTPRRGRLTVHLSRHEYEVAAHDDAWRMVIVGLESGDEIGALATASTESLLQRSPTDRELQTEWRLARYHLIPGDLVAGLPFLPGSDVSGESAAILHRGCLERPSRFAWLPAGD